MTTFLLAALVIAIRLFGVWLGVLIVALAGAFALAGIYVLVETSWCCVIRGIRRWRLARDGERDRDEHRLRSVALTGTRVVPVIKGGVPRRTWEAGEPPEGPRHVA